MTAQRKQILLRPQPGTWFALPLPSRGYALGLIARRPHGRIPKPIFCYFFGPRVLLIAHFKSPIIKKPDERIFFARTNDRGFATKRWIILDQMGSFETGTWPMPPFRSGAVGGGADYSRRRYVRFYDDNLKRREAEKLIMVDDLHNYPQDTDFGHVAMENAIDRVLLRTYKEF